MHPRSPSHPLPIKTPLSMEEEGSPVNCQPPPTHQPYFASRHPSPFLVLPALPTTIKSPSNFSLGSKVANHRLPDGSCCQLIWVQGPEGSGEESVGTAISSSLVPRNLRDSRKCIWKMWWQLTVQISLPGEAWVPVFSIWVTLVQKLGPQTLRFCPIESYKQTQEF